MCRQSQGMEEVVLILQCERTLGIQGCPGGWKVSKVSSQGHYSVELDWGR